MSGATATERPSLHRDDWDRDGYFVVPGVVPQPQVAELRGEVERLVAAIFDDFGRYSFGRYLPLEDERDGYEDVSSGVPVPTGPDALRMILPVVDISPVFAALARRDEVTAPARLVLGGNVSLFEDKLNLKPPGGAGFVWHQDWSCCWRAHTDELVTCFIYLDDSTEENGCLQVIPGTHGDRRPRPFRAGSTYEADVPPEDRDRAVPLPLRAGDMIAFDPYLLHYSAPNRSGSPRRSIIYTYNPARLGDLWSAQCHPDLAGPADRRGY